MKVMNTETYYSPRQVSEILGLKPRTITRWCREGKLNAVKVGRVWRVPRSRVRYLLQLEKRYTGELD